MKAAIYTRFSSDNQRTESINAQDRSITEFAYKNKYTIVHGLLPWSEILPESHKN